MFRASDVYGRHPGAHEQETTGAQETFLKRELPGSGGLTNRVWDPATGHYVTEEIPNDLQEMMGVKRPKLSTGHGFPWAESRTPGGLLKTAGGGRFVVKQENREFSSIPVKDVDKSAPSVEYRGFSKVELNERYYENTKIMLHGRPTWWNDAVTYFIYWQGEVQRWAICDASSFSAVRAGQYPGWAYKEDHRHLSHAGGWMEAWNGTWQQPDLEIITRSQSNNKAQWEEPLVTKGITTVEFRGFAMQELNTRYFLKSGELLQGKPSYWDDSGVYFIYWQRAMDRWAICDLKCLQTVKDGQCPGWCYRADRSHFANACGWIEHRDGDWCSAEVESGVIARCTKGLKVEFKGFMKREMNTQYSEREDQEVQGKPTYWDPQEAYIIYWQGSYSRWAICDGISLASAKKGQCPGWAFCNDSKHFAKCKNWRENFGRDWKAPNVTCTVLEGTVREDIKIVKAELAEETATMLSSEQYRDLLEKLYQEKNPNKLAELPKLLERYDGREKALYEMVCSKYQVDAAEFAEREAQAGAVGTGDEDGYAEHENEDLPVLSQRQYAILVQNVYVQHNAQKLEDLPRLLQRFRHRERELYLEVCKKYGVHPTKFHYKCEAEKTKS